MGLSPAEQQELQALQAPAASQGLSPEEQQEMKALQSEVGTPTHSALGYTEDALSGLGKGLDVLAAPVHAAIGGALQLAYPQKKIFDAKEALQGWNPTNLQRTPGVDDYAKRAGFKPNWFEGLLMNAGTDPATWLTMGGEAAAKTAAEGGLEGLGKAAGEMGPQATDVVAQGATKALPGVVAQGAGPASAVAASSPWSTVKNAVLNPVGTAAKSAGTAIYQKGIAPILQAARKAGKGDLTDFYMDDVGLRGHPADMVEQLEKAKGAYGNDMGAKLLAAKGVTVPFKEMLDPYMQKIQELTSQGHMTLDQAKAAAEKALAPQMEYVAKNGYDIPVDVAHSWRQGLDANKIPQAVWGEGSIANKKLGNQLTLSLRKGMNDSIDSAMNKLSPEAGGEFRAANQNWGRVASPKIVKAANQMADSAARARLFSPWDAAYAAGGMGLGSTYGHAGEGALLGLAARKGIQAAQSPWALTNLGMGLSRLGESKYLAPAMSAGLRQSYKDNTK